MKRLPRAHRGDPVRASLFNTIREAFARMILGGPGIRVQRVGDKIVIGLAQERIIPKGGTARWSYYST